MPLDVEQKQVEALKALADWSKWLISIESGLSAAIVLAVQGKVDFGFNFIFGALLCFFISILAATWLLGGIPSAMQQIPHPKEGDPGDPGDPDVHGIRVFNIPLGRFATVEHAFFIVALIFLGVAICCGEFPQSTTPTG
jgi:hypothetical protein